MHKIYEDAMTENEMQIDPHFMNLVMMLQMSAMQMMGKIASPVSGNVEKNLDQCRISIDMLEMMVNKTHGNLNQEEQKFVNNILYNLRMNFLEESQKGEEPEDASETTANTGTASGEGENTSDTEDPSKGQSSTEMSD